MKLRFNALAETPLKQALALKKMLLKLTSATNATHSLLVNKKLLTQAAVLKDSKNALANNKCKNAFVFLFALVEILKENLYN